MSVKYVLKNVPVSNILDQDVAAIYCDSELIGATTDREAFSLALKIQQRHDALAASLLFDENTTRENAEWQFLNLPTYVFHIVRVTKNSDGSQYEENVHYAPEHKR